MLERSTQPHAARNDASRWQLNRRICLTLESQNRRALGPAGPRKFVLTTNFVSPILACMTRNLPRVAAFRNQSVSYLIGLHAYFPASRTILSGDRNIHWDALNQSCPVGFPGVVLYASSGPFGPRADVFWTNAIHGVCGNLLFVDGAAEEFSSAGLQAALNNPGTSCGSSHHFVGSN